MENIFNSLGEILRPEQSKHTPGEWKLNDDDKISRQYVNIVGTKESSICSIYPLLDGKNNEAKWQEMEANARLIASAPALLEENKQLKQQVQDYAQIINDGEVDKREQGWMQFLAPIINEYKEGNDEPLDGDEVDRLTEIIRAKINLHQGNLTEEEYNSILNK